MKRFLLATCIASVPGFAVAAPLCGMPMSLESPAQAMPSITLPPPAPGMAASTASAQAEASSVPAATNTLPPAPLGTVAAATALASPILRHVAAAGAVLEDQGVRDGLPTVVARSNGEFMLLTVAPSGEAMVAGIPAELSVARLKALAGAGVTDLGERHGMRGFLVRNGDAFQVFYATPNGERVIPGVMWDATGKNLTREQVSSVEGTIPTVTIGDVSAPAAPSSAVVAPLPDQRQARPASTQSQGAVAAAERTNAGSVGNPAAPHLWMFADPQCGYSVQAMQRFQPMVASGKVRLSVVPVAILDHQNAGRSSRESLAMLSKPSEQMVTAWSRGDLQGPASADAATRLRMNMEAAQAIGLRGTPTLVWRRADGTEGRQDGMPSDVDALITSMQGR